MEWIMKEFDSMSVEELEIAKRQIERQLSYEIQIAENTTDDIQYWNLQKEINDLEILYELVLEQLGIL